MNEKTIKIELFGKTFTVIAVECTVCKSFFEGKKLGEVTIGGCPNCRSTELKLFVEGKWKKLLKCNSCKEIIEEGYLDRCEICNKPIHRMFAKKTHQQTNLYPNCSYTDQLGRIVCKKCKEEKEKKGEWNE